MAALLQRKEPGARKWIEAPIEDRASKERSKSSRQGQKNWGARGSIFCPDGLCLPPGPGLYGFASRVRRLQIERDGRYSRHTGVLRAVHPREPWRQGGHRRLHAEARGSDYRGDGSCWLLMPHKERQNPEGESECNQIR